MSGIRAVTIARLGTMTTLTERSRRDDALSRGRLEERENMLCDIGLGEFQKGNQDSIHARSGDIVPESWTGYHDAKGGENQHTLWEGCGEWDRPHQRLQSIDWRNMVKKLYQVSPSRGSWREGGSACACENRQDFMEQLLWGFDLRGGKF